ncbi:FAD-dependent monooxygenase [Streptomyces sp. NPDC050418]|uniref:FAD-dependent monooxygenase n=1 Tax=Streptomyces sp. NPDC050418 TaxID=3365612 RepID=UPI00379D49C7
MKQNAPGTEITVHERNPKGANPGWGVTYWPDTLELLEASDSDSARAIHERSECWQDGLAFVDGQAVEHPGGLGYAVGREQLLDALTERAGSLGVDLRYGEEITAREQVGPADLVIVADGINSRIRGRYSDSFGTQTVAGSNRFLWLGTTRTFDNFSFAFSPTPSGWIWCYAYRFSGSHSTCVVECSEQTWTGLGLDTAPSADTLRLLEGLFASLLQGHELICREDGPDRRLPWQVFRTVTNQRWSHEDMVLMGDAAHSTHYSIGAGTALAFRDAIALAGHLRDGTGRDEALSAYEKQRKAELLPVQSAARLSAKWYENVDRYLALPPHQMFALLGQRHSPLLPYVPPSWYYRLDHAISQSKALRSAKRWAGPRLGSLVQRRR